MFSADFGNYYIMSNADRIRWDTRYSDPAFQSGDSAPSQLVMQFERLIGQGNAWDLAGGAGRNGLYLAERGYRVTVADISAAGLERCRMSAKQRGLHLRTLEVDFDNWKPPVHAVHLVNVTMFFSRQLFRDIDRMLKPGGICIYESFNERYRLQRPDFSPDYLIPLGFLREAFAGSEILYYADGNPGQWYLSQIVIRKSK